MDESYCWYLQSLTNRVFHHLKEISKAISIVSTSACYENQESEEAVETETKGTTSTLPDRISMKDMQASIAKLLQCSPSDSAVKKLIQAAQMSSLETQDSENEDDQIPHSSPEVSVSLNDLFKQVLHDSRISAHFQIIIFFSSELSILL